MESGKTSVPRASQAFGLSGLFDDFQRRGPRIPGDVVIAEKNVHAFLRRFGFFPCQRIVGAGRRVLSGAIPYIIAVLVDPLPGLVERQIMRGGGIGGGVYENIDRHAGCFKKLAHVLGIFSVVDVGIGDRAGGDVFQVAGALGLESFAADFVQRGKHD